ncbi:MAG TPA: tail fiber protein [Burkholderiaceae bacterium]|nr:tail fiber protein [Burkholderiaceae bacterium]
MSEPFLGEIRMVGFNFAPRGWLFCQGQLLPISQNTALFSLLGTTFGGDGISTFALPDYRSRQAVGIGTGPGLTTIIQGEKAGTETVTMGISQMPEHTHTAVPAPYTASLSGPISIPAATTGTTQSAPVNTAVLGACTASGRPAGLYNTGTPDTQLAPFTATVSGQVTPGATTIGATGSSQPLPIRNPYLGTNFIIATEGIFPSRP